MLDATRTFSGDLEIDVASEPASLQVGVFRPGPADAPGDSVVRLRAVSPAERSRPVYRYMETLGPWRARLPGGAPAVLAGR